MRQYLVTWVIEVDAESPREAAEEALKIQRDHESTAVVFTVEPSDLLAEAVTVDLEEGG